MSMDYNTGPKSIEPGDSQETPMFAAIPSWERGKKRRGLLGRGKSAGPVAAPVASTGHDPILDAPMDAPAGPVQDSILDAPMDAPARPMVETRTFDAPRHEPASADLAMAGVTVDPMTTTRPMTQSQTMAPRETIVSEPMTAAPIERTHTTTTAKKGGVPAAAIAAGVVALGGLAAAGWYASQPKTEVATITPGAPGEAVLAPGASSASTELAAAPPAPAMTAPAPMASTPAPAARRTTTTTTRTAAVRTRPAPAAAASVAGVDASATLPGGPQPYAATSSDTSATSPSTVNPAPAWTIPAAPPPVEPAPATSATTETPATPATPAPEPQTAPQETTQP